MNTNIKTFLDGKPRCFAVPLEFHLVNPRCELCRVVNDCGCAVRGMIDAIENKVVSNGPILEPALPKYKRHLSYWDDAHKHPVRRYPVPLLEGLVERAAADQAVNDNKPTQSSPSQAAAQRLPMEDDPLLAELLGDLPVEPDEGAAGVSGNLEPSAQRPDHGSPDSMTSAIASDSIVITAAAHTPTSAAASSTAVLSGSETITCALPVPVPPSSLAVASGFVDLQRELAVLIDAFDGADTKAYDAVRERFREINFALNVLQSWAPRFRNIPVQKLDKSSGVLVPLQIDRQVIDLHWLWCTRKRQDIMLAGYETLLRGAQFDFPLAAKFASEGWAWHTKAEYLNLSSDTQWKLCAIQSEAISKRWKRIKNGDRAGAVVKTMGAPQVRAALESVAKQPRLIPQWVMIWMAATICNKNWAKTARLHALITGGSQCDVRQLNRTFDSVEANLDKAKVRTP